MWIDVLSRWLARERINGTHASERDGSQCRNAVEFRFNV